MDESATFVAIAAISEMIVSVADTCGMWPPFGSTTSRVCGTADANGR